MMATGLLSWNYVHNDIEEIIENFLKENAQSYLQNKEKCPFNKECIDKIQKHLKNCLNIEMNEKIKIYEIIDTNPVPAGSQKTDTSYQNICINIFNTFQTKYKYYGM